MEEYKFNEYDQNGSCVKCVDGYILSGSKQKYCIKGQVLDQNEDNNVEDTKVEESKSELSSFVKIDKFILSLILLLF